MSYGHGKTGTHRSASELDEERSWSWAQDGQLSSSGVWIAADFRSNLIIDRYDPVFADMRASKLKHLRSANSEDAVT